MNRMSVYGCLFSIFIIVGCSSGDDSNNSEDGDGSVMASTANDLQGTFASPCEVDTEDGDSDQSSQQEMIFSGSNVTSTLTTFIDTSTCDSDISISININAAFSIDGTQTPLADGSANNIDLVFSGGSTTGSPALLAAFESQGTTLAAFLATQGTTGDLNNLSNAELGITQAETFDIFRLDTTADGTDRLTLGDTNGSFTGDTPELRPISLDPDPNAVFLRVL